MSKKPATFGDLADLFAPASEAAPKRAKAKPAPKAKARVHAKPAAKPARRPATFGDLEDLFGPTHEAKAPAKAPSVKKPPKPQAPKAPARKAATFGDLEDLFAPAPIKPSDAAPPTQRVPVSAPVSPRPSVRAAQPPSVRHLPKPPSVRAPEATPEVLHTFVLSDGSVVLAMPPHGPGQPIARSYTSPTLAQKRLEQQGDGWDLIKRGRRWYIHKIGTGAAAVKAPKPTSAKPSVKASLPKPILALPSPAISPPRLPEVHVNDRVSFQGDHENKPDEGTIVTVNLSTNTFDAKMKGARRIIERQPLALLATPRWSVTHGPGEQAAKPTKPPKSPRVPKAKPLTFKQHRGRLLDALRELGWDVKPNLKVPHATSPYGGRLWFKAQAVYYGTGTDIGGAHSLSSDMRADFPTVTELIETVEARRKHQHPAAHTAAAEPGAARARVAIARYLDSVSEIVRGTDHAASVGLENAADFARDGIFDVSMGTYEGAIVKYLRALAREATEARAELYLRAVEGLRRGDRGPIDATRWALTQTSPAGERTATRDEASRIEAELDRLRKIYPTKKVNAVREAVRAAVRMVKEACEGKYDTSAPCETARDALDKALKARRWAISKRQGDLFSGFKKEPNIAAAKKVIEDIEALSQRMKMLPSAKPASVRVPHVGAQHAIVDFLYHLAIAEPNHAEVINDTADTVGRWETKGIGGDELRVAAAEYVRETAGNVAPGDRSHPLLRAAEAIKHGEEGQPPAPAEEATPSEGPERRTTAEEAKDVARTILEQIPQRVKWELGVVQRIAITDKMGGLELRLGGAVETRGKRIRIILNYADTYDVEVYRVIAGPKKKILGNAEGIYFDDLERVLLSLVFPKDATKEAHEAGADEMPEGEVKRGIQPPEEPPKSGARARPEDKPHVTPARPAPTGSAGEATEAAIAASHEALSDPERLHAESAALHALARDAHRSASGLHAGGLFALHTRVATAHDKSEKAHTEAERLAVAYERVRRTEKGTKAKGKKQQDRTPPAVTAAFRESEEAAQAARFADEDVRRTLEMIESAMGAPPPGAVPQPVAEEPAARPAAPSTSTVQVEDIQSAAKRRDANLAAMRLAAELAKHPRPLTDDDKRVLAQYSGWGGLSIEDVDAKGGFPPDFPKPGSEALIHEYYTPTKVCQEVARVVHPFLEGVNGIAASDGFIHALEPSAGVGRFVRAFQGPGFENLRWHAVEYSPLSAAILRALRPDLDLFEGPFQKWVAENEANYTQRINLVVGNPPYGEIGAEITADPKREYRSVEGKGKSKGKSRAYKYFLRRSLDLLAPGGIGTMVIPTGFLSSKEKEYVELRGKVLRRHHLMCAYRLPGEIFPGAQNPAFDVVFFRARNGTLKINDPADERIVAGDYFADFHANILGQVVQDYGRWKTEAVVGEFKGLPDIVERPICAKCAYTPLEPLPQPPKHENVAPRSPTTTLLEQARLSHASVMGQRVNWFLAGIAGGESEVPVLAWEELHRGLVDWAKRHGSPWADKELVELAVLDAGAQRFLNAFVKGSTKLIPGLATKPVFAPRFTGTASDVVAKAEYLYRQHRRLRREDLGALDIAPLFAAGWCEDGDALEPPDVYYFGHLWPKYDRAEKLAEAGDTQAALQAAKLLEIIKPSIFDDIRLAPPPAPEAREGQTEPSVVWPPPPAWFPLDLLEEWISVMNGADVRLQRKDGLVTLLDQDYDDLGGKAKEERKEARRAAKWGGAGGRTEVILMIGWINHDKILFRPPKRESEDIDIVRMRVSKEWSQAFVAWAGADPERREKIERAYQRMFQGFRAPDYGTTPLPLARWYKGVKLAPHQNAGARRAIANRGGLVAFDVGVGKTYTGLAIVAAARQEGWVKRPVIMVPASIIWKWDRDIRRVLPDYRVGIVGSKRKTIARGEREGYETSETDSPADRAATWSRFQSGEFDVVLMTYEALGRTKMRESSIVAYAKSTAAIQRAMALRQRNLKGKKKLTEREQAVLDQGVAGWVAEVLELPEGWKYDPGIVWEDIGIDMLVVDEAQNFKNLYMPEEREAGVPKYMGSAGEGSARSWQLDFRTSTVRANTGGAGVVLLSATPAKNSPVEFYNLIQYVDHDAWTKIGVTNPEQFIDLFCRIEVKSVVNTSTMQYQPMSICAGFMNLDMLRSVIFKYGEFKTAEQVGLRLPSPEVKLIDVDMTAEQEDKYVEYLQAIEQAKERHEYGEAAGYRMRLPLVAVHVDLDEGYTWPKPKKGEAGAKGKKGGKGTTDPVVVDPSGVVDPTVPDNGVVISVKDAMVLHKMRRVAGLGSGNPYKVLAVERTATQDEIGKAFRQLSLEHHPDRNPGDPKAAERFKEINNAYQVLSDPAKRTAYDIGNISDILGKAGVRIEKSAADVPNPHSPKFDALAKEIVSRKNCGHIVFCDNIAAHWWIKTVLEQAGVDSTRIAVMNGITAKEVAERQRLAIDFNGDDGDQGDPTRGIEPIPPMAPKYDVIIGNAVMHEGVDLQRRTCAIHHIDLPYEPSTLQQRNGRGHRQGNKFSTIAILYYFARRSSDGGRYQLIKGKLGWMTSLLDSQVRDTNNPGAQAGMSPEEEAILESRDPERTRQLIEEAKARHEAEVNAKIAHEASTTLRGVADRFWRARNAKTPEEAARMRSEGEQRLSELARVSPVAWPWMSWAVHARDVMMLVPPKGESPVYPGLRLSMPSFSDPTVKEYIEFGRTFEGKAIGVRAAGGATWTELSIEQVVQKQIKPEHVAEDWPADDDARIAEAMRDRILTRLRNGVQATDVWNRQLAWHWAPDSFLERQWPRFGPGIIEGWKALPSYHQVELKVPVLRKGVLLVGIHERFDSVLPPTDAGYAEFLRLALPSPAKWGELDDAARFWWGKSIPRNLFAGATDEQRAAKEAAGEGRKRS